MAEFKFREYATKPVRIFAAELPTDVQVPTLEGTMQGNKGDMLIIGLKGELYPCKPDIFSQKYKLLEEESCD